MATRSQDAARRSTRLIDRGIVDRRSFVASVYIHMAGAVAVSAAAAFLAAFNPVLSQTLFTDSGLTLTGWAVTLAPLLLVIVFGARVSQFSVEAARLFLLVYATLVGLSLGGIFFAYNGESIGYTFLAAAAGFAGLAGVGAFTKRDLGPVGSFLTLALFGLLAAMLLNLFLLSPIFDVFLAGAGILLFAGLTAVDVQRLRGLPDKRPQAAVVGALVLYLDFINLFLSLLRFVGRGRR
jgi:FtsH-binding integral membrane protein